MQMVSPDLIADLCGLSLGLLLAGVVVGFVLWLFGWQSHRFWVVLLTTVAAGVYGLQEAAAFKTPPLVAALLLAVAAGILALALVRLLAFGAGGSLRECQTTALLSNAEGLEAMRKAASCGYKPVQAAANAAAMPPRY